MHDRRDFLAGLAATALLGGAPSIARATSEPGRTKLLSRSIPSTGEALPVIGMGTSRTFDVPDDPAGIRPLEAVVRALFDGGATLIDSSPMYGKAERALGAAVSGPR